MKNINSTPTNSLTSLTSSNYFPSETSVFVEDYVSILDNLLQFDTALNKAVLNKDVTFAEDMVIPEVIEKPDKPYWGALNWGNFMLLILNFRFVIKETILS